MKIKKIPINNLDYLELYAEELKNNPKLFEQQKMLIESQIISSHSIFKKMFGDKNFKEKARRYLKDIGVL
mgnify:FL=1